MPYGKFPVDQKRRAKGDALSGYSSRTEEVEILEYHTVFQSLGVEPMFFEPLVPGSRNSSWNISMRASVRGSIFPGSSGDKAGLPPARSHRKTDRSFPISCGVPSHQVILMSASVGMPGSNAPV